MTVGAGQRWSAVVCLDSLHNLPRRPKRDPSNCNEFTDRPSYPALALGRNVDHRVTAIMYNYSHVYVT